ncbi:MAG: DUF2066 domain-containing protein [Candidatus Thiodiazotropha sp.]|jgi:uncharacterized protein
MNLFRQLFFFRWLLPALAILAVSSAWAESVDNLYESEVPVSGQGANARATGIRNAFARVLIKVSGDRGLLNNPDLAPLLNKASGFVQQYRYKSLDLPAGNRSDATPDRLLWARFDTRAVNRQLRKSGIPVWGETRPSMLIWLGEEKGAGRSLLSPEQKPGLKEQMDQVAYSRGIPLVWPLMDIEDQSAIQVSDLWGGFEESIRRASDRYSPDAILVGRFSYRGGDSWQGKWILYLPDKVKRWQDVANSKQALASEGLEQAADALALRFAPRHVSQGGINLRLRVHGLTRLADYVLVQDYLRSLAMIEQVDLLEAGSEKVDFLLRVQGNRDALVRGIQLGAVLDPVVSQENPPQDQSMIRRVVDGEGLDYRLR